MKKIILVFYILCLGILSAYSQNPYFTIIEDKLDISEFPTISTTIQWKSDEQPLESDFKIIDDLGEDTLDFQFVPLTQEAAPTQGRLLYFLIDASSYTNGIPIDDFKNAIMESLNRIKGTGDLMNMGYFGHPQADKSALTSFEGDFNGNFTMFQSNLKRIYAADSLVLETKKAIYETIDFMRQSNLPGQKILVVISGAMNQNSSYTRDLIVRQAQKNQIIIHTINYKINNSFSPDIYKIISADTEGSGITVSTKIEIENAIRDIIESRANNTAGLLLQYQFSFVTGAPADGAPHTYSIAYKQEAPVMHNYNAPSDENTGGSFLGNYGFILILIFGLCMGLGYWYYNELQIRKQEEEEAEEALLAEQEEEAQRRLDDKQRTMQDLQEKNIRLQEQLKIKEHEIAKRMDEVPTVVPPGKHDLKNTVIAGGGGAPVFKVSAGSFSQNYRLNKPTVTIGRASNNDVIIPHQTVSNKHASVTIENGSFFLNDLNSTNGTFVNGSRIDKKILKSGDVIKLGIADCRFEI